MSKAKSLHSASAVLFSSPHNKDENPDQKQQTQFKTNKFDSIPEFLELVVCYFSEYNFISRDSIIDEVNHFTDLLRPCLCHRKFDPPSKHLKSKIESIQSATKLNEARVEFEKVETTCLDIIKFEKGKWLRYCPCFNCSWLTNFLHCFFHKLLILKLPRFELDDYSECVFRNSVALEQCHYPYEAYATVSLMDMLINTREDVDLLIEKKVIVNYLGSSKVAAELFRVT